MPVYNNYIDAYKTNFNNKELTDEDKKNMVSYNRDQRLKSTKKTDEIRKSLWIKINRNDFNSLIQDVYNNLNDNEFKTSVDKKTYDLKNAKNFLLKITTQKIGEKEVLKVYSDLITPDINKLKNTKGRAKNKRNNILNVLENLKSVFNDNYFHYKDKQSKSESEDIAERTELKRQRFDEIANKEEKIDPKRCK